jgi:integrase
MPKLRLTAQGIRGLPIPAKGRVDYQDIVLPGLVLRVAASGVKSYSVSYWRNGARPRVTLGLSDDSPLRGPGASVQRLTLAAARDKATAVLRAVRIGVDPAAERRERQEGITFAELAREYIERWAKPRKRAKGAREDERRIAKVLIPRWGKWKARDVGKRHVIELLDEYADRGTPYARNRMQSLLSKVFNFGIKRDVVVNNPALGIDRESEAPRTRLLSDSELRTILPLFQNHGLAGLGFYLLLLTGQRPIEVFGMRWIEVSEDSWTLPGTRSKNRRPNVIPLTQQSLAILAKLRRLFPTSEFVFPSRVHGKPLLGYQKAAREVKAIAMLGEDWNIYDLKTTCLTGLARLGIPPHVVSAVANHAPQGVTRQHYAFHDYLAEKRDALSRWGAHVENLDPSTTIKLVKVG